MNRKVYKTVRIDFSDNNLRILFIRFGSNEWELLLEKQISEYKAKKLFNQIIKNNYDELYKLFCNDDYIYLQRFFEKNTLSYTYYLSNDMFSSKICKSYIHFKRTREVS